MPNLHPQAEQLLNRLAAQMANQPKPDRPPSPAQAVAAERDGYRATIPLAGPPEPVFQVQDLEIPSPDGPLQARAYHPSSQPLPVLVYYHGGGFNTGDLDTHDPLARTLANAVPCIVLAVAYRLAPEHPYPAAVRDAWAALLYAAHNAPDLGAAPGKLAVAGDSAGGTLAAVIARHAALRENPALALQVLLYANTDAAMRSSSWQEFGDKGWILTRQQMSHWLDAYLPASVDRASPDVSPLLGPVPEGLAPALVITAECDPLRDEGEAYAAKLQQAGIAVQHVRYPGMIHGFAQMGGALDAGKQALAQTASALRDAWVESSAATNK